MSTGAGLVHPPPPSLDAVVVIPGIMGSALQAGGRTLWGAASLGWYARAWRTSRSSLDDLALSDEERAGRYGRVTATGLLRAPAWAPVLRGVEPYTALVDAIREEVADPAAVLEFPYDWRLPVTHNAGRLERAARDHLAAWRSSDAHAALRRAQPDPRPAQLVLVAHSMGGLLARALPDDLDVRAVVTLGTPFDGAAVAATLLNAGRGAPVPLPRARLRAAAATMPGLHDLLPTYRCLDDPDHDTDPRRLTPADVAAFGGDLDLATASFASHDAAAGRALPHHRAVMGTRQATSSSLTLLDGVLEPHPHTFELTGRTFRRDRHGVLVRTVRGGDGTVPDNSALPHDTEPMTVAQQHGALTRTVESIHFVRDVLRERDRRAERLGGGDIGLDLPDIVDAGTEFAVVLVAGVDGPTDATVTVHRGDDPVPVAHPTIHRADGRYQADVLPERPGIHRVTVTGRGTGPVTQLVLAVDPDDRVDRVDRVDRE